MHAYRQVALWACGTVLLSACIGDVAVPGGSQQQDAAAESQPASATSAQSTERKSPPSSSSTGKPAAEQDVEPPVAATPELGDRQIDFTAASRRQARATEEIRRSLEKPVSVEFTEAPLSDVLAFLAEQTGMNIVIDSVSLDEEGIAEDEPITLQMKDRPVREVLRELLEPLELTWRIEHEVLQVTTDISVDRVGSPRIFSIRKLIDAGLDADTFVDMVSGTTLNNQGLADWQWTASRIGNAILVRDEQHNLQETAGMIRTLEQIVEGQQQSGTVTLWSTLDAPTYAALARPVSVDVAETPLSEALQMLTNQSRVRMRVDAAELQGEGISADVPVTLTVKDVSLQSALRLLLDPLGCEAIVDRGSLLITTGIAAEERLFLLAHVVRDLTGARLHLTALAKVAQESGGGPWLDTDGVGGTIYQPLPGVLVVLGTLSNQERIAATFEELRLAHKAGGGAEGKRPAARAEPEFQRVLYPVTNLSAEEVADTIPKMIEPESWQARGGKGAISMVGSTIVVLHTLDVHRQIRRLLSELRREAGNVQLGNSGPFGGPGGSGSIIPGSGFFQVK